MRKSNCDHNENIQMFVFNILQHGKYLQAGSIKYNIAVTDTKYSDNLHMSVLYFPLAKLVSVELCLFQHNSLSPPNSFVFYAIKIFVFFFSVMHLCIFQVISSVLYDPL